MKFNEYDEMLCMIENENVVTLHPKTYKKQKREKLKKRFYAFFCDLTIIGILQKVMVLSYINFIKVAFHMAPAASKSDLMGNLSQLRLSTLVLTYFSYFLICNFLGEGKTVGKTIFNLRVVSTDFNLELSFMESFMRTLGYTICYITGSLLFIIAAVRSDGRGVPDFLSQTEVLTDTEVENRLAQIKAAEHSRPHCDENEQLQLFAS